MVAYYVIGGLGVTVLLLSVLVGDLLPHGAIESLDVTDGFLSTAALGGFAGAFGLAGGVATASGAPTWLAVLAGIVVGLAVGVGAGYLVRALKNGPEHPAPSGADLVGATAMVVSPIPAGGFGEVSVTVNGIRRKVSALADRPFAAGAQVQVTHTLSPTSVRVATMHVRDAGPPQDTR
ncbi:MAG: hypothetical protein ABI083_09455 [Lapillicoccus sp.]